MEFSHQSEHNPFMQEFLKVLESFPDFLGLAFLGLFGGAVVSYFLTKEGEHFDGLLKGSSIGVVVMLFSGLAWNGDL